MQKRLGDTAENVRAKRRLVLFGVIFIFFGIVLFIASMLFAVGDTAYNDLAELIKRREERYGKSLILFTDAEYDETISKDYKDDDSYRTIVKNYGDDLINVFLPGLNTSDIYGDDKLSEKEKKEKIINLSNDVVKKYLKAERENFNKITWNTSMGYNQYKYKKSKRILVKNR